MITQVFKIKYELDKTIYCCDSMRIAHLRNRVRLYPKTNEIGILVTNDILKTDACPWCKQPIQIVSTLNDLMPEVSNDKS